MLKYRFINDYSEGAHPSILDLMLKTNLEQESGYGEDAHSLKAAGLIKEAAVCPQAAVHFVTGGTQANLIALGSMMKPYEAVIAASTAHINVHEAGAIEATGHKVCTASSADGKITPGQIQAVVDEHTDEHMVKPRVVFVSNSTEVGTAYCKQELEAIAQVCRKNQLYLYLDGARLGSALTSAGSDLSLADVCRLADAFYIGGTKNGALLGEALVICNPALQQDFRYHLKQHGALLAKGRLVGQQFTALFSDGLYFRLASHANAMAQKLTQGISQLGYGFLTHSTTNQIFPILPNDIIARLEQFYGFYVWEKVDAQHSAIRLVTSWATQEDKVDGFLEDLAQLKG